MLQVDNLSCARLDDVLFSNLKFSLHPGAVIQFVAANGFGKTTLLRSLAGLSNLVSGVIKRNYLASIYIGHKSNFHPTLSIRENLSYLGSLSNFNSSTIDNALDFFDLSLFADRPCSQLSAGQLKRANLSHLIIAKADLWLLDEPFANLDVRSTEKLLMLINKHLLSGGAVLFSSHSNIERSIINIQTIELEKYA